MKAKRIQENGGVAMELAPYEAQIPSEPSPITIRKVLVPVDFSDCSTRAVDYALAFANQFGAQLTLLHVVEVYPPVPEMGPVDFDNTTTARKALEKLQQEIGVETPARILLRTGTSAKEITDAAAELEADVIILATHGRTGLSRVLLGSTAEKVVRHAPCPVLIVREKEHDFLRTRR